MPSHARQLFRDLRLDFFRTARRPDRRRILRSEVLEPRLALAWSGVPPASIAIPVATAVTLDAANDATGTASIAGTEVDYYSFTAPTTGTYTISATTPTSSLDSVLGVFSATGQRLAYNDDISFSNTDSRVQIDLAAGTRVYVGVTNYSFWSRGAYTWTIDGPAPAPADDAYENNDSFQTASNLGTITAPRTIGQLVMADSQDWYAFTTTAAGTAASSVSIAFLHAQGDLDMALYNAQGSRIGLSQGTGNSETISLAGLSAGTYYLRVYGYGGALNPNYALTITPPAATTPTNPTNPTTPTNPTGPVAAFPDVANYGGTNDWNLNSINAPEAWAQGYQGQGVVVAVVDTGVDLDHADLSSQIWVNPGEIAGNGIDDDHNGYVDDTEGWDFVSNDNNPDDGNGHGTHVAGTIAAEKNGVGATGVAPEATIMPVRVLGSDGSGTMNAVAAGIRYAAQNGANIINLSLGGSFSSVIQAAIQYAEQLNVLVVVAAGNESASTPSYPARFSATLDNVISVGAYNSSGAVASFSNDVGNSGAVQVDAPGVNVYSTYLNGRYATLSGTSMATPQVAGLAALALSANPHLTASQLRSLIVGGANHSISGSDARGGINAALTVAMAAAGQTSSAASATTTTSAQQSLSAGTYFFRIRDIEPSSAPPAQLSVAAADDANDTADGNVASRATAALQSVDRSTASRNLARDSALAELADGGGLDLRDLWADLDGETLAQTAENTATDSHAWGAWEELLWPRLSLARI